MTEYSRRSMLCTTVAGLSGGLAPALYAGDKRPPAPKFQVDDTRVISHLAHRYHGWPTLARRRNGQLLLVCSGGRESHVCPFGRVELMRSDDGGAHWSWPQTLIDSAIDDRDAGVLETSKGSLLVTTFTSLAFEQPTYFPRGDAQKVARWIAARDRVPETTRKKMLGAWIIRSTDGGQNWSSPSRCGVNSPHGPIALANGDLLYAGKELYNQHNRIGAAVSVDDGVSWKWAGTIPSRPGDDHRQYHELHAVEAAPGRLVAHIRNHNPRHAGETLQSESTNGGRTWTTPHEIGVWGLPSHLLKLADGRLLMSYGHRRRPFGNQVRISDDAGATWSEPMGLSRDGAGGDLGYPSTVQLDNGHLVTAWYEKLKGAPLAVLRQARWQLTG
ncbi:glycoside hydrolase [Planctomycetaceae bacterium]|nr:glycoside hydrolase [Planctomycetaceae bacterium]